MTSNTVYMNDMTIVNSSFLHQFESLLGTYGQSDYIYIEYLPKKLRISIYLKKLQIQKNGLFTSFNYVPLNELNLKIPALLTNT